MTYPDEAAREEAWQRADQNACARCGHDASAHADSLGPCRTKVPHWPTYSTCTCRAFRAEVPA